MRKLSIEEKAQRYDEAIKRAKELLEIGVKDTRDKRVVLSFFPELSESEDERIRKRLIHLVNKSHEQGGYALHKDEAEEMLAWLEKQGEHANFRNKIQIGDKVTRNEDGVLVNLSQLNRVAKKDEKQGEQKPADKVEPKFKVGDWITNGKCTWKIDLIDEGMYYTNHCRIDCGGDIKSIDEEYHLWTIQDAKDGDILFQDLMCGKTFIYNGINPNMAILYSFIISNDGKDVLPYYIGKPNTGIGNIEENKNIIHPATKEQRDLLFQKMKEAGYEWDAEKKELKKIVQNPIEWNEKYIADVFEKVGLAKIAREQSNDNLTNALQDAMIELSKFTPQPKQEWSEEDEKTIVKMRDFFIRVLGDRPDFTEDKRYEEFIEFIDNRLKSLRGRFTWKPSDEQIGLLQAIVNDPNNASSESCQIVLKEVIRQLKKLKE